MESKNQNISHNTKDGNYCEICQSQYQGKPEHHLTCDVHIRARGHKSETITHCPHKDTNMPSSDVHDQNKNYNN